jgi:hypothetical protein
MSSTPPAAKSAATTKRTHLSQSDVPGSSLEQALRVARAIADNYAYNPTRPVAVAEALQMSPTSGPFKMLTGAAVAYGLTTGAAQAPEIGLSPIGLRIVRPTVEGDDVAARREALLKPRVVGEFLRDYDGAALPTDAIAKNVLEQKGVPHERVEAVLELILDGAKAVGFVREWNGKRYVDLAAAASAGREDSVGAGLPVEAGPAGAPPVEVATQSGPLPVQLAPVNGPAVTFSSGVNINIEIHIAADADSRTIEDIFKNMRRYVLRPDSEPENAE